MLKLKILFLILLTSLVGLTGTTPITVKLLDLYKELMTNYSAEKKSILTTCMTPLVLKNKETRKYRTSLGHLFKDTPPHVNFCGNFFVFNTPITGGGDLFIADCSNGKVYTGRQEYASNHPLTSPDSCLVIEYPPEENATYADYVPTPWGPPRLYWWKKSRLIKIKDPIWPKP